MDYPTRRKRVDELLDKLLSRPRPAQQETVKCDKCSQIPHSLGQKCPAAPERITEAQKVTPQPNQQANPHGPESSIRVKREYYEKVINITPINEKSINSHPNNRNRSFNPNNPGPNSDAAINPPANYGYISVQKYEQ